jgi:hypothetical protein
MSEFDLGDFTGLPDLGGPEFWAPVQIPDTFEPPPDIFVGLAPFEQDMFDPVGVEFADPQQLDQLAAQQLAQEQLAAQAIADAWDSPYADGQLTAESAVDDPSATEHADDRGSADGGVHVASDYQSRLLRAHVKGRFIAAVKETKTRGRGFAGAATEKARNRDLDRYMRAAEAAHKAGSTAVRLAAWGKKAQDKLATTAGASRGGAAAGRATRRFTAELQRLPILSAASDALQQKNAISELAERFEAEPDSPYTSLWLGEALRALERDMRVYAAARAVYQPTSLATRHLLKTGARLGAESGASASEQFLSRAFVLADLRVKSAGFDAQALDVIARVYLAKGSPGAAVGPATLALRDPSDPDRGAFYFTLGRACLGADNLAAARRAAELAIESGMTLGYELLAEMLFREDAANRSWSRCREYADLLAMVDRRDRVTYYGADRSAADAVTAVLELQKVKLLETFERGKSGLRAATERIRAFRASAVESDASSLELGPQH